MAPAAAAAAAGETIEDRMKNLGRRLSATRRRYFSKEGNGQGTAMLDAQDGSELQDVKSLKLKAVVIEEEATLPSTSGQGRPTLSKKMSFLGKEIIDLEADCGPSKDALHKFVNLFYPVLKDVPDWVSGRYSEFKDDSVRLCTGCNSACEWIFFRLQPPQGSKEDEMCADCFNKVEGRPSGAEIFLREGVVEYLAALDGAASTLIPDQQE